MNALQIQYHLETGKKNAELDIKFEESDYIDRYYLVEQSQIDKLTDPRTGELKISHPDYVEFLEEQITELQKELATQNS